MSPYISFDVPVSPVPVSDSGDFCTKFDAKWLPYIIGALQVLLDNSTYEADQTESVQQAHTLIGQIQTGVCEVSVPIGAIIMYATANVPANCLECNGASYLREDYPDLYDALDPVYQTNADNFVVPDFRGRAPIGKGTGTGLTARTMNTAVGSETQALTINQLPAHTHNVSTNNAGSGATQGVTGTTNTSNQQTASAKALATGAGEAHNNMQPSRVTGFCIVATIG